MLGVEQFTTLMGAGQHIERSKMGWVEDLDLPNGESHGRKENSYVSSFPLFEFRQTARLVRNIPLSERHREVVKLMGLLGDEDINSREAEYIHRRINALRGLRADGRPKGGVDGRVVTRERRRENDPVWKAIRGIKMVARGNLRRVK